MQGVIQIAAAFHHYARGNPSGTRSLLEAGLKKLEKFPAEYHGVNAAGLCAAATAWLEALSKGEEAPRSGIPRIELLSGDG